MVYVHAMHGWHPDPQGIAKWRWWDGREWTDLTRDKDGWTGDGVPDHPQSAEVAGYILSVIFVPIGLVFLIAWLARREPTRAKWTALCCLAGLVLNVLFLLLA